MVWPAAPLLPETIAQRAWAQAQKDIQAELARWVARIADGEYPLKVGEARRYAAFIIQARAVAAMTPQQAQIAGAVFAAHTEAANTSLRAALDAAPSHIQGAAEEWLAQIGSTNQANPQAIAAAVARTQQAITADYDRLTPATRSLVTKAITGAVVAGEGAEDMARRLNSGLDGATRLGRARSMVIARTELADAYDASRLTLMNDPEYADVIYGWEWHARNDKTTCPICRALQGRIFPKKQPTYRHHQCRCVTVPILEDDPEAATPLGGWGPNASTDPRDVANRARLYEKQNPRWRPQWALGSEQQVSASRLTTQLGPLQPKSHLPAPGTPEPPRPAAIPKLAESKFLPVKKSKKGEASVYFGSKVGARWDGTRWLDRDGKNPVPPDWDAWLSWRFADRLRGTTEPPLPPLPSTAPLRLNDVPDGVQPYREPRFAGDGFAFDEGAVEDLAVRQVPVPNGTVAQFKLRADAATTVRDQLEPHVTEPPASTGRYSQHTHPDFPPEVNEAIKQMDGIPNAAYEIHYAAKKYGDGFTLDYFAEHLPSVIAGKKTEVKAAIRKARHVLANPEPEPEPPDLHGWRKVQRGMYLERVDKERPFDVEEASNVTSPWAGGGVTAVHDLPSGGTMRVVLMPKTPGYDTPFSFGNSVQVLVPPGNNPLTAIREAANILGVPDTYPGTAALREFGENRLLNLLDKTWRGARVDQAPDTDTKRRSALARVKAKYGVTVDDLEWQVGDYGEPVPLLPRAVAEKIRADAGVKSFIHNLSSDDWVLPALADESLPFQITSTVRRWTEGIGGRGMSSATDVTTGGAESVYLRQKASLMRDYKGVVIRTDRATELLRRMDWYAYQGDSYGTLNPAVRPGHPKRSPIEELAAGARVNGSQETMMKGRIVLEPGEMRLPKHIIVSQAQALANRGKWTAKVKARVLRYVHDTYGRPHSDDGLPPTTG